MFQLQFLLKCIYLLCCWVVELIFRCPFKAGLNSWISPQSFYYLRQFRGHAAIFQCICHHTKLSLVFLQHCFCQKDKNVLLLKLTNSFVSKRSFQLGDFYFSSNFTENLFPMKWSEVKVAQSCWILCHLIDWYSPWNSPGQNTVLDSLFLLQGIFPTQGSNPGLSHCKQILYQLSHKGSLLYL